MRADLATRVDFQPNSPALIFYPYKQRPALGGWIADERAATFVVQSHDGSVGSTQLEGYRLKEPEQIRREKLEREGLAEEHTSEHRGVWMLPHPCPWFTRLLVVEWGAQLLMLPCVW